MTTVVIGSPANQGFFEGEVNTGGVQDLYRFAGYLRPNPVSTQNCHLERHRRDYDAVLAPRGRRPHYEALPLQGAESFCSYVRWKNPFGKVSAGCCEQMIPAGGGLLEVFRPYLAFMA